MFHLHVVDGQSAADSVRTLTIVAFSCGCAGGLVAFAGTVLRSGHVSGTPDGIFHGGDDLVGTDHEIHAIVAEEGGTDAVASAVDVDQLTGFGHAVDGGKIDVGHQYFFTDFVESHTIRAVLRIPDLIVGGQAFKQFQGVQRFGIAEAHQFVVDFRI